MSIDALSLMSVTRPALRQRHCHLRRPRCQRPPRSGTRPRLGVRGGFRSGLGLGVRFEPDTQPDPGHYPTTQVTASVSVRGTVATDPLLGISLWGRTPYRARHGAPAYGASPRDGGRL